MMEPYLPREDSELLSLYVREHARGRVIDIGTGSGIQAFTAAALPDVTEVVAVDINPEAIAHAKRSAQSLPEGQREKISFIESDMFESVDGVFDTIICNPPYLPDDHRAIPDPALDGGSQGHEWSGRFLREAKNYIAPNGIMLFLFSNLTNKQRIDAIIKESGYRSEELGMMAVGFFERIYVYRLMVL